MLSAGSRVPSKTVSQMACAVDGERDGLAQVLVAQVLVLVVDDEVVRGVLGAEQHLLAGVDGVAVRRLAVLGDGGLDLALADLGEVQVAGLELGVRRIGSLKI